MRTAPARVWRGGLEEVHTQCLESRDLSLDKLSAGSLRRLTPSLRRLAGEEH